MNDEQDVTIEPEENKKGKPVSDSASSATPTESDDVVMEDEMETPDQIKKLREKLKKAVAEKQEYLDGWQRERAQFANLRKQDEKDKKEFIKFAKEEVVTDLIPVLESFEMARSNKEVWEKVDKNWRMGVEYIHSQLKQILESHGVTEVNPEGQDFDPMRDEAVEYIPVENKDQNNKIVQVIQKGYNLNGKAIKAPRVKVGEFKKTE